MDTPTWSIVGHVFWLLFKKSPKCQNIYLLVYFNSPDRKSISIQVHWRNSSSPSGFGKTLSHLSGPTLRHLWDSQNKNVLKFCSEIRAAHQSEHPSSLRSIDFVVSIKPRVCFWFFSLAYSNSVLMKSKIIESSRDNKDETNCEGRA